MLALTMGDPNGIGPEIINRYLVKYPSKKIMLIGNKKALGKCPNEIIDPFGELSEIGKARATAENGLASYAYVKKAIELAKTGTVEAVVTAPLNKTALHLAGINYDGHTEILAAETGVKNFAMMFWSPQLKIILTTIHKALKNVPELITQERLQNTLDLAYCGLRDLGLGNPQIAVCGLNPHAGEEGAFGREEIEIIQPIIAAANRNGKKVYGPFPADTLFIKDKLKKFDLIIAHYHDQGLIPLKMLAFHSAVNITVGLPIVRTSVDHGTAYDLVGKNSAAIGSLKNAIRLAWKIASNRKKQSA